MRRTLIPTFLLVLGAVTLGATLFPEQIAHAAMTPFQNVVVTNTSTNPVPVQQVGTSTTSVTGTVGIDSNQNTVKLDSNGNTVNLGSTDSGHLANIDNATGQLHFDSSGNLKTTTQTAAPGAVTEQCLDATGQSWRSWPNDGLYIPLCSGQDFYVTSLTASGMDDNVEIQFLDGSNVVLDLWGSGSNFSGSTDYQMNLTHPIHVTDVQARCANSSSNCDFTLELLGNSAGT